MKTFISIADIGPIPPESYIAQALGDIPVERTLDWVAHLLRVLFHSESLRRSELSLVREWFGQDPATASTLARALIVDDRALLAPAVLKLLADLALVHGSDAPAGGHEDQRVVQRYLTWTLPKVMLTIAHYYGDSTYGPGGGVSQASPTQPVGRGGISQLELELAANILANHSPYPKSMFHRSQRRWIEIPEADPDPTAVNLAQQFHAATGARLDDLRMVGLALHGRAISSDGPPRVSDEDLPKLGIGSQRLAAVLQVICAPLEELRSKAKQQLPANLYDTPLLSQYPVVRLLDGQLLVLGPDLLAERVFGWLPKWDLQYGRLPKADADRAVGYLETATEYYARESLTAVAVAPTTEGTVYGGNEVQQAWGTQNKKNADAVLIWPGQAIIVEISSRAPTLDTLRARSGPQYGLAQDLNLGVIEKARQLDATVAAMRTNPAALTGDPTPPKRFRPVLITTEGFPVVPTTVARIHRMIADAGLLVGADVAPLVILDVEALEAVESIGERHGLTLPELLAAHEQSHLAAYGFREWVLTTYPGTGVPSRIQKVWSRHWDQVLSVIAPDSAGVSTP